MKVALDIFLTLLVLVVFFWIALFGLVGVSLALKARLTRIQGFFVGSLLGPVGLIWLLIRGRGQDQKMAGVDKPSVTSRLTSSKDFPPQGGVDLNI